ncbi:MAG: TetR/AcrR family transcriptional regulator [Cohaesibacter sp.]|nr:TetR/AcrR family transcriptional regulator [Cohaesibacter sp.]
MNVNEILLIFAQYGFRKASMEDLARAAGMSRQALYKRFGSKDGVFEWAVQTFIEASLERSREKLGEEGLSPAEALASAFAIWTGEHVGMLHNTPHGMEMMDRAIGVTMQESVNIEGRFYEALAQFSHEKGLAPDLSAARELVFTISMAAKGLMLKSRTEDEFNNGMKRVLAVLLKA